MLFQRLISLIPIPGQSLMDTIGEICKYQPAITRAAWFMKCILLKMAFGKSPQTLFAEAMTKYIQAQVDKLKAPSAATPLNIVGNMKGSATPRGPTAFKSPEARNAFILPWLYCVEFVSYCYFEGLLDQRKTLLCVLERFNLKKNSFSQGVIMIPLVWNLLGEFVKSKALTRSILESIIPRTKTLKTIRGESEVISMQYQNLLMMIQYIAISEPDAFVSPMWAGV
ncbi:hypothetical protein BDR26DRAFT_104293 [Obelidium mucronatum]|nr:hypothetical protein BDR26DRAFT_104293 [Obelidium mucronatum]